MLGKILEKGKSFWRQQQGAVYFMLFLAICASLVWHQNSQAPQQNQKLVDFSLQTIETLDQKMEKIVQDHKDLPIKIRGPQQSQSDLSSLENFVQKQKQQTPSFSGNSKAATFRQNFLGLLDSLEQDWKRNLRPHLEEQEKLWPQETIYGQLEELINKENTSFAEVEKSLQAGREILKLKQARLKESRSIPEQNQLYVQIDLLEKQLPEAEKVLEKKDGENLSGEQKEAFKQIYAQKWPAKPEFEPLKLRDLQTSSYNQGKENLLQEGRELLEIDKEK